jgi:hypothetical protein
MLLVAQSIRAALDDTDPVVEALDETERDLVFRLAVGGDSIPMTLDHLRELLVVFEPLPLQIRPPIAEKAARPTLALAIPKLVEGPKWLRLFEQLSPIYNSRWPMKDGSGMRSKHTMVLISWPKS